MLQDHQLSERIIAAAITVHKDLGPGFLESVYEEAMAVEFNLLGIHYEQQKAVPIQYRRCEVGEHRLDFLAAEAFVVELKATTGLEKIHFSIRVGREESGRIPLEDFRIEIS